ncbi:MAG: type II toxin-antitoxin system VapC family toxin [Gloeomargaritaceae cyanobacterium C42_A2020_066]|nr:type II toxin-antitoxin system VapC family toxin [Gloeomargaritaceae cyanobacterium C42_A2020_066]
MTLPAFALIDAGPLIAYYNTRDRYHHSIRGFLVAYTGQPVTIDPCITEAMHYLRSDYRVQVKFAEHIAQGLWQRENLAQSDFNRVAELIGLYRDLPGDFADLSLVAVSERLDIPEVITLDSDFDVYRRYRRHPFKRIYYPSGA